MNIITEHRAAIEAELSDYLAERIPVYAGDFSEWMRGEDPDNYAYCLELIQSLALANPLTAAQKEQRLEAFWDALHREMAEEYAHGASYEAQFRTIQPYSHRRGF